MARHEKGFEAAAEAQLPHRELRSLPGAPGAAEAQSREDALACFLAAEDGWVEAARRLGGAFALAPATNPDGSVGVGDEKGIANR